MCLIGGWQLGEARSRLTRSRVPRVMGKGSVFGFLWLSLNWTREQKLGKLPIVDQSPAIWAGWCWLWVRVLSSDTDWPCLYFSLSSLNALSIFQMGSFVPLVSQKNVPDVDT